MPRELSTSELENFPALDWSDVAPRVTPELRSSLERILETQNGDAISQEEACALAHAEGDDLLGLLAAANLLRAELCRQPRHLRRESQHQFHQHLFCGMQVLRLQPRPARVRHIFSRARASRAKGRRSLAARRHRSLHSRRTAARPASVLLSRHSARREECRAGNAHPRLLADGNRLRRRTHRHAARRLSLHAAR